MHDDSPYGTSVIQLRGSEETVVVSLHGEHDLNGVTALELQLVQATSAFARRVVIDCTGAAFIDSHTLAAIARARGHAQERGIGFEVLVEPGSIVFRAFEVARLLDHTPQPVGEP